LASVARATIRAKALRDPHVVSFTQEFRARRGGNRRVIKLPFRTVLFDSVAAVFALPVRTSADVDKWRSSPKSLRR
jgi:hypothetical protein